MQRIVLLLTFILITIPIYSAQKKEDENKYTQTSEFARLKSAYVQCVLSKGVLYSKVSTVSEVIKFAPIACKRKLLIIKQFYLNSAFKVEVISELVDSIREGVEIDLVKEVYKDKLINYRDK